MTRHLVTQNGNVLYLRHEYLTFLIPSPSNLEDPVIMRWLDDIGLPVRSFVSPQLIPPGISWSTTHLRGRHQHFAYIIFVPQKDVLLFKDSHTRLKLVSRSLDEYYHTSKIYATLIHLANPTKHCFKVSEKRTCHASARPRTTTTL
jgi:hypothetical protein